MTSQWQEEPLKLLSLNSPEAATDRAECAHMAGRLKDICNGTAYLPISKINAYRTMWGLDELPDDGRVVVLPRLGGITIPQPEGKSGGKGCGCGQKKTSKHAKAKLGTPGTELLAFYKAKGMPACQACIDLAATMDEWGVAGCRERLEEIVTDMLPRAKVWVSVNKPWAHAILPGIVEDFAIKLKLRADVTAAIDAAEKTVKAITVKTPCCKQRTAPSSISSFRYADAPALQATSLATVTRHLTFHLWPVAGYGAWQWNCDQLLKHSHLFNGKRIVSIAISEETDSADLVREYLKDFTDEFIIVRNDPKLREVVTWLPMLRRLEPYQSVTDVTFSCHGKCVRHKISQNAAGSTIFPWTEAMYETCLNWDAVRPLLEKNATVGTFRRRSTAAKSGWGQWHWTGTFFWWRNQDAFRREWDVVPQQFFGTEAWPGRLFRPEEAGVLVGDNIGDLYVMPYWATTIEPQLSKWREQYAQG